MADNIYINPPPYHSAPKEDYSIDIPNGGLEGSKTRGKVVDVVENYTWCVPGSDRSDVPYIQLIEFQQNSSNLIRSINYWGIQTAKNLNNAIRGGQDVINPYEGLYLAEATGYIYKLPWLESYNYSIANGWGYAMGAIENFAQGTIAPFAAAFSPGAGIEQPRTYEGSQAARYNVSFPLLNTVSPPGSHESDVQKNWILVNRLIRQNLQKRNTALTITPPCIYEVTIPGVRYSPAAVISNVEITNVGQLNVINGLAIPDAWNIKLQIMEIVQQSRNIFDAGIEGSKVLVQAIADPASVNETLTEAGIINKLNGMGFVEDALQKMLHAT